MSLTGPYTPTRFCSLCHFLHRQTDRQTDTNRLYSLGLHTASLTHSHTTSHSPDHTTSLTHSHTTSHSPDHTTSPTHSHTTSLSRPTWPARCAQTPAQQRSVPVGHHSLLQSLKDEHCSCAGGEGRRGERREGRGEEGGERRGGEEGRRGGKGGKGRGGERRGGREGRGGEGRGKGREGEGRREKRKDNQLHIELESTRLQKHTYVHGRVP